jgi:hypothetical protein
MKHHWADLLDRNGGYWQMVPNRDRYAYQLDTYNEGDPNVKVVTIQGDDKTWDKVFSFPNLKEITLHKPCHEQLMGLSKLVRVERLRITHARAKTLDFISPLQNLKELVLEYVSGCSDLSPLSNLDSLSSLHFEKLRGVSSFDGLSGLSNLLYLSIDGTFDWKQPIESFEFLRYLHLLEFLSLGNVTTKQVYPALMPVLGLKYLKYLKIERKTLDLKEYALLDVGLRGVKGASWPAVKKWSYAHIDNGWCCLPDHEIKNQHPEVIIRNGIEITADREREHYDFLGKGERGIKCKSKLAGERCEIHFNKYEALKDSAKNMLKNL